MTTRFAAFVSSLAGHRFERSRLAAQKDSVARVAGNGADSRADRTVPATRRPPANSLSVVA
jgi:hypothetical protein